jgi:hypothetical protein
LAPAPTATHIDSLDATPYTIFIFGGVVGGCQLIPLVDVIMGGDDWPPATHKDPFHATPYPAVVKSEGRGIQFTPSKDVAIVDVPWPTATHIPLFDPSLPYANAFVLVVKLADANGTFVQLIPSNEYAIVFIPDEKPPANHIDPLEAMQFPKALKSTFPIPVHIIPS